ncbi:hypothetical protein HHI36_020524 [Cryptolaemus montrouzieri]|uniref:EF-hand domain-containing protein n=1 Tax=Cryptolaemus montrouzieri TaxID=559131 RepID=A0ABD2NBN7_9CUCU
MLKTDLSMKQLMRVFKLCNPDSSGNVKIEYLLQLAENYITNKQQVQEIGKAIEQLDPEGNGSLSFQEFSSGIRTIIRRQDIQARRNADLSTCVYIYLTETSQSKNLMMSPTTVPTDGGVGLSASAGRQESPPGSPQRRSDETKSQCSSLSDGDNYEWTAVEADADADSGISADRNIGDGIGTRSPSAGINRHTWLRTSLRRSSPNHQDSLPNRRWGSFRHNGKRQLGSNALASQLYRSSSFNSSGRSSTCDTTDDMYSDASLEEDVHDLHHKVSALRIT